jgi:hypothetical protein
MEGTASADELAMMAGMELTVIGTARAGEGWGDGSGTVVGWLLRLVHALMARRRGERGSAANAWGMGENDGADKWARATREREWREREGGESLTGGAELSAEARARGAGPPGLGRGEGERGRVARVGLDSAQPRGESFSFSFSDFYFLSFPFLFLFLFISFSFEPKIF